MVVPFLDGFSLQNYALTNSRNFCWGEANAEAKVKILGTTLHVVQTENEGLK